MRIELRRHLLPLMPATDGCNGFGKRWLEHELLVLESVLDVGRRPDVSGNFVERSHRNLQPIGCAHLPRRFLQGCSDRMDFR